MPRIDPLKLLTCLKVLLASNGGIRSTAEVKRLAGLMAKYSKKLVSKCIYIQILKCTETELLGQFMGLGGWSLTHMWLSEGIRDENWPLVQEILELLLLCPVDVQRLRSNTSPKLVKILCKDGGNEGVKILAMKLVEQWLKIVKGEGTEITQIQGVGSAVPSAVNDTLSGGVTNNQESTVAETNNQLPQQIILNSNKSVTVMSSPSSSASNSVNVDADPLAVSSPTVSNEENMLNEQKVVEENKNESALVYRLVVKDGKQVLAKVENNLVKDASTARQSIDSENEKESDSAANDDSKETSCKMISSKNEKDEDLEVKEDKDAKEKDKGQSSSSKDKEKHRDHKSSSSSSHHKSSSKSSSSRSSNSSSSSRSKSSSSSSHRNSSDTKSRDKDSDKEKHKSSSSSSSKDKHRDRDKDKSSSKDKDRERRDSKSSRDKDRERSKTKDKEKHTEKEDEKEKEKLEQAEKDKETLSKVTANASSLEKLGRIPKKPKDESGSSPSAGATSITIPSKKASMSIEIRKDTERPKTVKTYNSQFRSHGLTDEAPPPPSRKGLKKPASQSIPGTSIPSSLSLKRSSPPPTTNSSKEAPPVEKKPKIDMNSAVNSPSEKPGAIKLIAPKPKPSTLVESDMFMDALSASACMKKDTKKRKRRPSATKETLKDGTAVATASTTSPPGSPTTPTSDKVTPLKFYQDTLEDNKDEDKLSIEDKDSMKQDKDSEKNEDEDDIPLKRVKEAIEQKVQQEKDEDEKASKDDEIEEIEELIGKRIPGPGCGPDGPPGVLMLHRRKGPKKKVCWKPQEELEEVRFFELDETERVNVTKTFIDMKQMERMNEREGFLLSRKLNCEDTMTEQTAWLPLILVDDVPPHPEGNQSKEKRIQAEREQTTLKALYFNRHMIPDSPSEPDMEQYQMTEPAVIPLDDITGNPDAVNDFTSMPWPDPKGSPPHGNENNFIAGGDMPFQPNQFNPFIPFAQQQWSMQSAPQAPNGPNGVIPGALMGPMGGFNNMNNMNPMNMNMNMPGNIMMGPKLDDIQGMNMNMGMIAPFGPGPNFAGGPPNPMGAPFNNFVAPPNMNMQNQQNFSPPRMDPNMNRGGPRGPMTSNNRGNWRSGSAGPPNQSGGNWRPQGPGGSGGGGPGGNAPNNWLLGNRNRICKQFQRGHCRNGNKCSYLHTTNNHHRI